MCCVAVGNTWRPTLSSFSPRDALKINELCNPLPSRAFCPPQTLTVTLPYYQECCGSPFITHWGSLAPQTSCVNWHVPHSRCSLQSLQPKPLRHLETEPMLIIGGVLQTLYLEKRCNVSSWHHRAQGRREPSYEIDRSGTGEMAQQSGVHTALGT